MIGMTDSKCLTCDPNSFYVDGKKECFCKDGYFAVG